MIIHLLKILWDFRKIFVFLYNKYLSKDLASIVGLVFMLIAFLTRTSVQKHRFNWKRIPQKNLTLRTTQRERGGFKSIEIRLQTFSVLLTHHVLFWALCDKEQVTLQTASEELWQVSVSFITNTPVRWRNLVASWKRCHLNKIWLGVQEKMFSYQSKVWRHVTKELTVVSINRLAFYYQCCSLIGYPNNHLFGDR